MRVVMPGLILSLSLLTGGPLYAGAACVVAKELGNSLAIELVAGPNETVSSATDKGIERLRKKGFHKKYQDPHAQAISDLKHAYAVVIKTQYKTFRGKPRTSYGCGFSPYSYPGAEQAALLDLQNYSWGWKPAYGYEVFKKLKY